ncbi:MAG: hypothetical protein Q4G60_08335 [bacterium]|nr:hypothetical protein [bacterium]
MKEWNKHRYKLIIAVVLFVTEIAYGFYVCYFQGRILNDAFSRTANAFYVIFVKPSRYASVGLVWNPLPSTLQLPFVALAKIWRPFASSGICAVIVTAIFAALASGMLLDTFERLNIGKKYAITVTLLYAFNPFIFFYGCNGMSESIFFTLVIYIVCNLSLWMKMGKSKHLVKIAFALVFLFFTRYEAIPFAAAVGLCVIIHILFNRKERIYWLNDSFRERYFYVEGTMVLLYTPMVYGVFLWILFNWVINGNPLYFLNSAYSNVSQSIFTRDFGSQWDILFYEIERLIPFIPLFLLIVLIYVFRKQIATTDFIIIFILNIILMVFHFWMLTSGSSFGWLRFFSYTLPVSISFIPYILSESKKKFLKADKTAIVIALLISGGLCAYALQDEELAKEELNITISNEVYKMSDYINENLSDEKVLMDAFLTNGVILNVENVDQLVVSSSLNFYDCVADPVGQGINYILVPDTSGVGNLDAVNLAYPDLYSTGADWCELEEEFEGFRLYRVID